VYLCDESGGVCAGDGGKEVPMRGLSSAFRDGCVWSQAGLAIRYLERRLAFGRVLPSRHRCSAAAGNKQPWLLSVGNFSLMKKAKSKIY